MSQSDSETTGWKKRLRAGPSGALVVVVSVILGFGPPLASNFAGMDQGWRLGLSWARQLSMHWGPEVLFTYGPWGNLSAPVPLSAGLAFQSLAFQLLVYALVSSATWSLTSPRGPWAAAVLAVLVTGASSSTEPATAAVIAVFLLSAVYVLQLRQMWYLSIFIGGLAGFSTLIKFNDGSTAVLIAMLASAAAVRWWAAIAGCVAGLLAGIASGWLSAGQSAGDFMQWASGSIEIARGYATGMGYRGPSSLDLAVATICCSLVAAAMAAWNLGIRSVIVLVLATAAVDASFFLHGYIRNEPFHRQAMVLALFTVAVPLAGAIRSHRKSAPARPDGRMGAPRLSVAWLIIVFACFASIGFALGTWNLYFHPATSIRTLVKETQLAVSRGARDDWVAKEQAKIREGYSVTYWEDLWNNPAYLGTLGPTPGVIAALRGRPVLVEPWAISLAWANNLIWDPAPVFQTYQAYTPTLSELNERWLLGPTGPTGVLRQSAAVDSKNPLWEAPQYQVALLCNFKQIAFDGHWQALVRVPNRCGAPVDLQSVSVARLEFTPVPTVSRSLVIAEFTANPGATIGNIPYPMVGCGQAGYRLAQGFPSGPLTVRADAAGWDPLTLPAPCTHVAANVDAKIKFTALPIVD